MWAYYQNCKNYGEGKCDDDGYCLNCKNNGEGKCDANGNCQIGEKNNMQLFEVKYCYF